MKDNITKSNLPDNESRSERGRSRRKNSSRRTHSPLSVFSAVICVLISAAALSAAAYLYCGADSGTGSDAGSSAAAMLNSCLSALTGSKHNGSSTSAQNTAHEEAKAGETDVIEQPSGNDDSVSQKEASVSSGNDMRSEAHASAHDDLSDNSTAAKTQPDPEQLRKQRIEELSSQGYIEISQSDPDTVSLCFAGDILFDERYAIMASMLSRSSGAFPDITKAFDDKMLSEMRSADIFIINNEFPYSSRGAALPEKKFTFRARPEYASLLRDIGTDAAVLANNHVNDYGPEAMTDTFAALNAQNIPFTGAGSNIEEASRPVYFTNGNIKLALIAATQIERMSGPDTVGATEGSAGVFRCFSSTELARLTESIHKAKYEEDCFVIVYMHWGTEGTEQLDNWQKEQSRIIADAGADIIIGDHPHVLQGIDYAGSRKVPVIYSLGNYLFNSKTLDTCLFKLKLDASDASISEISLVPAIQSGCRTTAAAGTEAQRILSNMQRLSPNTNIDINTGIVSSN